MSVSKVNHCNARQQMNMEIRNNWSYQEIANLFDQPLLDLVHQAAIIHRQCFPANSIQLSNLLSIKTGNCPEDCAFCPQSGHFKTTIQDHKLLDIELIIKTATKAKSNGATRFCMGAAWRKPPKKAFFYLRILLEQLKKLDLEICMTLGILSREEAQELAVYGLDYYNHNIETSVEFYPKIVTTHSYQDRLNTVENVRLAGIKVCCGGIVGMGESHRDRILFLQQLANLTCHPESVPINLLIPIKGTPLNDKPLLDGFEFIKMIAIARILMPKSFVRLSAGRVFMNDQLQAFCFLAGANSIFIGDRLLTEKNAEWKKDQSLFKKLGLHAY